MPFGFGFGKKENDQPTTGNIETGITDKDELAEISHIMNRLQPGENVLIVAKQSRLKPGGSKMTPDTIFVTNKHLIIRNPSMMGMRENVWIIDYDKISSIDLEKGVFSSELKIFASGYHGNIDAIDKQKAEAIIAYVKNKMNEIQKGDTQSPSAVSSVADEIAKLLKLKTEGAISDEEFQMLKSELTSKKA